MTAIEAMIYCLGYVSDKAEDKHYNSRVVYDCHGQAHWIAWSDRHEHEAIPRLYSESCSPFTKSVEPYRVEPKDENRS